MQAGRKSERLNCPSWCTTIRNCSKEEREPETFLGEEDVCEEKKEAEVFEGVEGKWEAKQALAAPLNLTAWKERSPVRTVALERENRVRPGGSARREAEGKILRCLATTMKPDCQNNLSRWRAKVHCLGRMRECAWRGRSMDGKDLNAGERKGRQVDHAARNRNLVCLPTSQTQRV